MKVIDLIYQLVTEGKMPKKIYSKLYKANYELDYTDAPEYFEEGEDDIVLLDTELMIKLMMDKEVLNSEIEIIEK